MNLKDEKIKRYKSLKPEGINYIDSINMTRVDREGYTDRFNIELIFQSLQKKKIKIVFSMVKNLKLSDLNSKLDVSLEIINIKDHQLEELNYKVNDYEEEVISFYCKDIDSIELLN